MTVWALMRAEAHGLLGRMSVHRQSAAASGTWR